MAAALGQRFACLEYQHFLNEGYGIYRDGCYEIGKENARTPWRCDGATHVCGVVHRR